MTKFLLLGSSGLLGNSFYNDLILSETDLVFYPTRNELDVTDSKALKRFISETSPDVIINCTGYNFVDKAELDEEHEACYELNVNVPKNLAILSDDIGFKLVHFSSDYVFDGELTQGYIETDPTSPINFYGSTKAMSEQAVMQNCDNFIIQRISGLFGPSKNNFVTYIATELRRGNTVKVVSDQVSNPTYSIDVVKATFDLVANHESGLFHTPNEDSVSWYELALEIAAVLKVSESLVIPISSTELNRLAKRPKCSILKNSRYIPLRSHLSALEEFLT